jgi:Cu(I)/Ag(I) efflux system protein CusF
MKENVMTGSNFAALLAVAIFAGGLISGATAAANGLSAPAIQLAQSGMIEGEVRRVDLSAGKVTLRHGPIPKHDMATAMTMVFQVRNPALLNGLNVGDKVLFDVEKEGGSLTVTQLRKAN